MKTRLPWLLVMISVAFNAFFAVGFLQARGHREMARTAEGRARLMAKRLELDDKQLETFEALLGELQQFREARAPRRDAMLAEIVKDEPSQMALEELLNGPDAQKGRLTRLAMIRKFVRLMRPEQREKWTQLVKRRSSASK